MSSNESELRCLYRVELKREKDIQIEIITVDEMIKKHRVSRTKKYDMIQDTPWYVMEFGFVAFINSFSNSSEPLNEAYAIIVSHLGNDINWANLINESGYYYDKGVVRK